MPERNGSADSFDEFFGESKIENVTDDEKSKQNDPPTKSTIEALIKSQPVMHHRRTPSQTKAITNSKNMPLTTNIENTPVKSKSIDSPPPLATNYDSDFDENTNVNEKKKHSSLPQSKERSPETFRRGSDSKLKRSYTITTQNVRRKQKFLPYIQQKNRIKRFKKEPINEVRQRVLSAQHSKLNELQSRLVDLERQLENERIENRTLRLIQKREEKALKKYEDQEYDVHKVARDYTCEIANVKEKISNERETKIKLEEEIEGRNEQLHEQTKQIKFYEKLIIQEPELDESDELRERLKENEKKIRKYQEKIANKEEKIQNLETIYSREIHQELVKQRELKHELQNHTKKYTDLQVRFEEKSRQVGTMHIYIQRGGRRPSNSSSINLSKARSLQSLEDSSPRIREKILEYDKKRREEEKLKPKPKPLPFNPPLPPPKPARKKYVPNIPVKLKPIKTPAAVPVPIEQPPIVEDEPLSPKGKPPPPVRRLSTPKSIDEDKSEIEDEIILEPVRRKSPSPIPMKTTIQRSEEHITQPLIKKRPLTPVSPPSETKLSMSGIPTTPSIFKHTETKSPPARELDDKRPNIFDTNKKDDLLSKLVSDEQQERKPVTTIKPSPPSMIMFEPSSIVTNGNQKKPPPPARITTTNIYDFDQTVINLHEGKPVTTQPTINKTSVDPFEALFDNNNNTTTTKSINHMHNRDDTFTTIEDQSDPFDSNFTQLSAANTSTAIQPNLRQIPTQNDKLQRPKIVTNAPRPIPNRTVVEEIEEFVL